MDPRDLELDFLLESLEDPALDEFDTNQAPSEKAKKAAYNVAVGLGKCRLFGIKVPEDIDGFLPANMAVAAAEVAAEETRRCAEWAKRLVEVFDNSLGYEAMDHCCGVLESCMDVYAAMQAIMDSLDAEWDGELFCAAHQLAMAIDERDRILWEKDNLEILSIVVELPLLANWRSTLVEPWRTALPWWLDGTLEEIAEQIEQECRRSFSMFRKK